MSRRRGGARRPAQPAATVDLRALARSFLVGEHGGIAILPEALARITAVARSEEPIELSAEDAKAALGRSSSTMVRSGVAVVPLQGVITPRGSWLDVLFGGGVGGLQGFRGRMREAMGNDDVTAIVLDVHSPGGLIGLVPETAAELRTAAAGSKPIVAVCNTMAASAAYWIASQAEEVIVTPSGFAGSIGVYLVHEDWSGFNEAMGVLPTYVAAGRYKTEGNPDEPLSEEAKAALQEEVDDLYALFVNDVAAGRGTTAQAVRSGYGEGRLLPAARALEASLVDRVATIDETIRELAGGGRERRPPRAEVDPPPSSATLDPTVEARLRELEALTPPTAV